METPSNRCIRDCFNGDFGGEETSELTWAESATKETWVGGGDGENVSVEIEDVFAWGGGVEAGACRGGGEGDGVDVSGGTEDEEVGGGTVEEAFSGDVLW
ncbi:hypothetical protein QVD17_40148 [Tagetes erecta]|uniref:Uncharacterized protein n=1 Tax=Tagetes erecta TaxID=13708 RepID=A0AAD8NHQ1_TARER|nr:hypothetical protein QVD17_40148 [Tagetes erecta]